MNLAKDCLDIGLITERPEMIDFFADEVALGSPERLPITKELTQYRFDVAGSVVKVNVLASFKVEARSGYSRIAIARKGLSEAVALTGPDEIRVDLVPVGEDEIGQLGIELAVPSLEAARHYFEDALGWDTTREAAGTLLVRVGRSIVRVEEHPAAPSNVQMPVAGWNYMTVQIHSCDVELAQLVERGVRVSAPARTLGEVARFAMVADPWGNPLEISERFSLVGDPAN